VVKFRPVTDDDVNHVADNMRQADVDEVWASNRLTPRQALRNGVNESKYTTTAVINGDVIGIFGLNVISDLTGTASPWFLGTDDVKKHTKDFLPYSRKALQSMIDLYPKLYNYVYHENKISIRWLKWLGFTVEKGVKNKHGEIFHRFNIGI